MNALPSIENRMMTPLQILIAAIIAFLSMNAAATEKGFFGIAVSIDGEGAFWNPTLKSVTVAKVVPRSPAEQAGIAIGDQIVEVEGRQIAGTKAKDLQPHMQKDVGQRLNLVLKKATGETKAVSIVAGPRPE